MAEKAKLEAEDKVEKIPAMTKDGRYYCANPGCADKSFLPEENGDEACRCHTGEVVFQDLKKYWTCCIGKVKPALDFDEFLKLPTCTLTSHKMRYKK